MKIHLQKELDQIKKRLFHLSALVEENLELAMRTVQADETSVAGRVIKNDEIIDQLEVEVEEDCLKILALHQPVAVDLRFLIAALKSNNDLERIGDLAVNIAGSRACADSDHPHPVILDKVQKLGVLSRKMLRNTLKALMDLDPVAARGVLVADDEVDDDYRTIVNEIKAEMTTKPDQIEELVCWMLIAKNLERVADLATNIAEDTIYTVEGAIIRHGRG